MWGQSPSQPDDDRSVHDIAPHNGLQSIRQPQHCKEPVIGGLGEDSGCENDQTAPSVCAVLSTERGQHEVTGEQHQEKGGDTECEEEAQAPNNNCSVYLAAAGAFGQKSLLDCADCRI